MSKQIEQAEEGKHANLLSQVVNCLSDIENLLDTDNRPQIDAWYAAHILGIGKITTDGRNWAIVCSMLLNERQALLEFRVDDTLTVYFKGVEGRFVFGIKNSELYLYLYSYLLIQVVRSDLAKSEKQLEETESIPMNEFIKKFA